MLRAGGLVAFPTETVYGLGADAEDVQAVERIFAAKGRPRTHPLIAHIGSADQLDHWAADVPESARLLAERFWPGPLTLVLRRSARVPLAVTGGIETVALRVPDHPLALALLSAFAGAVAAPSANRFGSVSPTTADHVREGLGTAVDFVLDGGPCAVGVESTIVDVTSEQPAILRPGGVSREALEAVLRHSVPMRSSGSIRAPGQHSSHYAPRAKVLLVEPNEVVSESRRLQAAGHRVGALVPPGVEYSPSASHVVLCVPGSMVAYAQRIYTFLLEFDRQGCEVIVASLPAQDGLGLAIADRLRRAAGGTSQQRPDALGSTSSTTVIEGIGSEFSS